jgi:hypothetical protein
METQTTKYELLPEKGQTYLLELLQTSGIFHEGPTTFIFREQRY